MKLLAQNFKSKVTTKISIRKIFAAKKVFRIRFYRHTSSSRMRAWRFYKRGGDSPRLSLPVLGLKIRFFYFCFHFHLSGLCVGEGVGVDLDNFVCGDVNYLAIHVLHFFGSRNSKS